MRTAKKTNNSKATPDKRGILPLFCFQKRYKKMKKYLKNLLTNAEKNSIITTRGDNPREAERTNKGGKNKMHKKNKNVARDARITFLMSANQKERLQILADEQGLTMSSLIRVIVNEYLKKRK